MKKGNILGSDFSRINNVNNALPSDQYYPNSNPVYQSYNQGYMQNNSNKQSNYVGSNVAPILPTRQPYQNLSALDRAAADSSAYYVRDQSPAISVPTNSSANRRVDDGSYNSLSAPGDSDFRFTAMKPKSGDSDFRFTPNKPKVSSKFEEESPLRSITGSVVKPTNMKEWMQQQRSVRNFSDQNEATIHRSHFQPKALFANEVVNNNNGRNICKQPSVESSQVIPANRMKKSGNLSSDNLNEYHKTLYEMSKQYLEIKDENTNERDETKYNYNNKAVAILPRMFHLGKFQMIKINSSLLNLWRLPRKFHRGSLHRDTPSNSHQRKISPPTPILVKNLLINL